MNEENPYAVTSGSLEELVSDRDMSKADVSSRTIQFLNETRPWVRMIGILLWIGTVLLGMACVFTLLAGLLSQDPKFLIISVLYIGFTFVYWMLAKALTKYATYIKDLSVSGRMIDLENAMEAQRTFWKTTGMMMVVVLVIYIIAIAVMVASVFMMGTPFRQ